MLVDPAATPLVIQGFVPGSPAATSGLRQEDILCRIDHQHNPTHDQLFSIVEQLVPGDSVGVQVTRGNKELEYRVELVSFDYIEQAMQQRSDSTE